MLYTNNKRIISPWFVVGGSVKNSQRYHRWPTLLFYHKSSRLLRIILYYMAITFMMSFHPIAGVWCFNSLSRHTHYLIYQSIWMAQVEFNFRWRGCQIQAFSPWSELIDVRKDIRSPITRSKFQHYYLPRSIQEVDQVYSGFHKRGKFSLVSGHYSTYTKEWQTMFPYGKKFFCQS